jgi:hypothetical protein
MKTHGENYEKKMTIQIVMELAQARLSEYEEPQRAGTPRGEAIGMFGQKFHASFLMALYPQAMRFDEIGKIIGTSPGVLRVWRTQSSFKKAMAEANRAVANEIIGMLKKALDENLQGDPDKNYLVADTIAAAFRYLSPECTQSAIGLLVDNFDAASGSHEDLRKNILIRQLLFSKFINKAELARSPAGKEFFEFNAFSLIDSITHPKAHSELGGEKIEELTELLKRYISSYIEILT